MRKLTYVVFGAGRVGRNIAFYLERLGHHVTMLSRAGTADQAGCAALIAQADVVCAAIPDAALPGWLPSWREALRGRIAVHFSGALLLEGSWSFHPLYSFPKDILSLETLRQIAFARQENAPPLGDVFPGADNPTFVVADKDRAFYHALAVLAGNFPAAVWNEIAKIAAERLKIEPQALAFYLSGVVERFAESPYASMTGPVARRDAATVEANLKALQTAPHLRALYEAFLDLSWPDLRR
jgi:predicted short-subunit dehydrogenase-like oxidoreductase (DUF2520 family)